MTEYTMVPDWDAVAYSFSSSVFEGDQDSETVCFLSMGNTATTVTCCTVKSLGNNSKSTVGVFSLFNRSIYVVYPIMRIPPS